jgi:hypothetical protein
MKKITTHLTLLFFLLVFYSQAQLGPDVRIKLQPGIQQSKVKLDVAFNGWLYAAYSTFDSINNAGGINVCRSKDNGLTWTIMDSYTITNGRYTAFDVVVTGTDTASLKLFLAGVKFDNASNYNIYIDRYDAYSGTFDGSNYNVSTGTRKIYDVAIASDYQSPAVGASPYSVAIAYSVYSSNQDSINYVVSTDAGATFLPSIKVATTGYYFRNLDLAYGKSSSASNGRYFIAFERMSSSISATGNIYTARNSSTIDGAFNTPLNLDSISSSAIGLCSNPRIAVSTTEAVDNDSGSVTALVLVERDYSAAGTDYDVIGFCNKRAHYTDYWFRFDIDNGGSHSKYPAITYSSKDSMFMVSYLDSTQLKTRLMKNDYNLSIGASNWDVASDNYNNSGVMGKAWPQVATNPVNGKAALAWIKFENNQNTAYFDAEYSTLQAYNTTVADTICTGESITFNGQTITTAGTYADTLLAQNALDSVITLNITVENCTGLQNVVAQSFKVYPNPFSGTIFIDIQATQAADMPVMITDIAGRVVYQQVHQVSVGSQHLVIPASDNWNAGVYVLSVSSASGVKSVLLTKD